MGTVSALEKSLLGSSMTVSINHPRRKTRIHITGRPQSIAATLHDLGFTLDIEREVWVYPQRKETETD
jgi:alkylated DNA repair dioxygenase AlkB